MPDSFTQCVNDNDLNTMVYVKESINKLEQIYGYIPCKFAKGKLSSDIIQMSEQTYMQTYQSKHSSMIAPEIDLLIIFDRRVDMVTPFCFNHTYEGIIDEFFSIEGQEVSVPTAIINPFDWAEQEKNGSKLPENTVMNLTDENDTIFKDLRNSHFETLEKLLEIIKIELIEST